MSACHSKNKEMIISECEGKTKCERIVNEDYGRKDYINMELIASVRDTYKASPICCPDNVRCLGRLGPVMVI